MSFELAIKWLKENEKEIARLKRDEALVAAYMDGYKAAQQSVQAEGE